MCLGGGEPGRHGQNEVGGGAGGGVDEGRELTNDTRRGFVAVENNARRRLIGQWAGRHVRPDFG